MNINKITENDSFCPIPFMQLQLNPLGNVSSCCFSGEYKVGSVLESSIEEIWNNEKMQEWREEFISGDIKICKNSIKTFRCHKNFKHLIKDIKVSKIQNEPPKRLDLRLNGKCNLECVMCSVWQQPNHLYDTSDFWTYGREKVFPYLLEIDVLGGEPFIQKDTFKLIDEISKVNPDCTWSFITNGQYIINDYIENYLLKIKIRSINVSTDSINPETYPKIRKSGNLQKTLNTIDKLIEIREKVIAANGKYFVIFSSMCVQRDNWRELGDFLNFCDNKKISPILQILVGSEHLSISKMPKEEQQEATNYFKSFNHSPYYGSIVPLIEQLGQ